MRKYLTIKDNFVKVEFVHFWSRKPLTMLKHMEVFVERKTGLKCGTIATFDEYFLKNVATTDSMGNIHYSEEWEDTRGINASDLDLLNNPPKTKKLAWVLDMICQDGIYTYGYLGFSIEPGFGFSFKQGLKNPKAIKQRTGPENNRSCDSNNEENNEEEEEEEEEEENSNAKAGNPEETGKRTTRTTTGNDAANDDNGDGGSDDPPSLPPGADDDGALVADSQGEIGQQPTKKTRKTRRKGGAVLAPALPPDEIEKALDDLSRMIETNSLFINQ